MAQKSSVFTDVYEAIRDYLTGTMRRPLGFLGVCLTTAAGLAVLVLLGMEVTGLAGNPYLGILLFLVLPAVFLLGLLLMPLSRYLDGKRAAAPEAPFPRVDLNEPRTRNRFLLFLGITLVNLAIVAIALGRGIEYMDSVEFCGRTCHAVMHPELTAHQDSPHARVRCVDCHIGPGASWFVRSKLSGTRQVFAALFHTYPRPIPTPVENLRPSRDTCEQCHWPAKFHGTAIVVRKSYQEDEANTALQSVIALKIGGGRLGGGEDGGGEGPGGRADAGGAGHGGVAWAADGAAIDAANGAPDDAPDDAADGTAGSLADGAAEGGPSSLGDGSPENTADAAGGGGYDDEAGIHWHVYNRVEYVSDEKREQIERVRVHLDGGRIREFHRPDEGGAPGPWPAKGARRMDCVDCHNRPTHIYRGAVEALNLALDEGSVPLHLPYVRREGLAALTVEYPTTEAAMAGIDSHLRSFYRDNYPELTAASRTDVSAAVAGVQAVYNRNVFPAMNIGWGTYPDHIGHEESPGCFRCHDGELQTESGETISQECSLCHTLLAVEEEDPEILRELFPEE